MTGVHHDAMQINDELLALLLGLLSVVYHWQSSEYTLALVIDWSGFDNLLCEFFLFDYF